MEKLNLEDKVFIYLQEIYTNLKEFYEYVKNKRCEYVLTNMGVDGFESSLIANKYFTLKVTDRYSTTNFFTYKNKKGELFLPSSPDGIFYASRVTLYDCTDTKKLVTKEFEKVVGVLNMKSNEIIRFIKNVHDEVLLLNLNKETKVKRK